MHQALCDEGKLGRAAGLTRVADGEGGSALPRSTEQLALLDAPPGDATGDAAAGRVETPPSKASAMRQTIMNARDALAADRAAAAAADVAKTAAKVAAVAKATGKAMAKGGKALMPKATVLKRPGAATKRAEKPASWLKAYPHGCSKCRNVPGCTLSCWKERGGKIPK